MKRIIPLAFAGLVFALASCSDPGPPRYHVEGEVTFGNQPIPHGDIVFTPDATKDNSGPQGFAQIRDGKFDTKGPEGKGVAGGPTVVRITGFTGPGGKILCETEIQVDLPREASKQTFDVPAKEAFKGKQGPEI